MRLRKSPNCASPRGTKMKSKKKDTRKTYECHVTLHYHVAVKANSREEAEHKMENMDLSREECESEIIIENEDD